jgi:hypothetical protein
VSLHTGFPFGAILQNKGMKYLHSTSSNLRLMLVLVAVLPLVLALAAVVIVAKQQFDQLAEAQRALVQPIFFASTQG